MNIDLKSTCCIKIITKPNANSAAENIKKKKVSDNMLTLSKIKPINNTIIYNDIHISSAVNNKWSAVFTLSIMVRKKTKNKSITRFKSPNTTFFS